MPRRARPWIWRVWVLRVWVGEPWAASLSSCLFASCSACTEPSAGTSGGNAPLTHRPGAEQARLRAAGAEGLSHSTGTQKPISRCFSTEVFPQHCQMQSRHSAFLSAPPNRTASSAQAQCPPFSAAAGPAKLGREPARDELMPPPGSATAGPSTASQTSEPLKHWQPASPSSHKDVTLPTSQPSDRKACVGFLDSVFTPGAGGEELFTAPSSSQDSSAAWGFAN